MMSVKQYFQFRTGHTIVDITTIRSCCGTYVPIQKTLDADVVVDSNDVIALDADVVVDSGDDGAPAQGLHQLPVNLY